MAHLEMALHQQVGVDAVTLGHLDELRQEASVEEVDARQGVQARVTRMGKLGANELLSDPQDCNGVLVGTPSQSCQEADESLAAGVAGTPSNALKRRVDHVESTVGDAQRVCCGEPEVVVPVEAEKEARR